MGRMNGYPDNEIKARMEAKEVPFDQSGDIAPINQPWWEHNKQELNTPPLSNKASSPKESPSVSPDWEIKFDKKVKELDSILPDKNNDSPVFEFGYQINKEDWIYTVPDWGNIKSFIHKTIEEVIDEIDRYEKEDDLYLVEFKQQLKDKYGIK